MPDVMKLTRAEQKAMRPQQILDAAFEEFLEKGFLAARVEDIAARVGVTKGTVYLYFATKEELFEAVLRDISAPFAAVLPSVDAFKGTCADRIRQLLQTFYNSIIGDRRAEQVFRFVVSEGPRFPDFVDRHHQQFMQPLAQRLQRIVDEGVASGEFRETPATRLVEVIAGATMMMSFWRLVFQDRRPIDTDLFAEAHVDLVLNGLMTRS